MRMGPVPEKTMYDDPHPRDKLEFSSKCNRFRSARNRAANSPRQPSMRRPALQSGDRDLIDLPWPAEGVTGFEVVDKGDLLAVKSKDCPLVGLAAVIVKAADRQIVKAVVIDVAGGGQGAAEHGAVLLALDHHICIIGRAPPGQTCGVAIPNGGKSTVDGPALPVPILRADYDVVQTIAVEIARGGDMPPDTVRLI